MRASLYYQMEELTKAEHHAREAERAYDDLGHMSRRMRALFLRGSIRLVAHDLDAAAALYSQVIEFGEAMNDATWIAKGSYALANCEIERGNVSEASSLFHTALVIFRETGPAADAIATEWGLARVILQGGNAAEAARRLREVMQAFEELGMGMDATFVSLDLAEALVVLRQQREVAKIAARAFRLLEEAGVLTSALMALAYLKEAAANDRLRVHVVHEVRTFLRRAERNPALLFVPPPDTLD
jgi:tetratricopeptide (TPR) repeat protein